MSHGFLKLFAFEPVGPAIEAYVRTHRKSSQLSVYFELKGHIESLYLSKENSQNSFVDGLWNSTCFEIFFKNSKSDGYCEWNFSPSKDWAYFEFESYRKRRMAPLPLPPRIECFKKANFFSLEALITIPENIDLYFPSLILQDLNFQKTHWAHRHSTGTPDFHNPDLFENFPG